jgi:hypothetical protein
MHTASRHQINFAVARKWTEDTKRKAKFAKWETAFI